jgi:hypothetical protein
MDKLTIEAFVQALKEKGLTWAVQHDGAIRAERTDLLCPCPIHVMWPGVGPATYKAFEHGLSVVDARSIMSAADNNDLLNPAVIRVRELLIKELIIGG